MIRVGVLGVGTVGRAVVEILEENGAIISARAGEDIVVKSGAVRDVSKVSDLSLSLIHI